VNLQCASTGATVHLGQLVGRGGEGTVHAVVGAPKLVAKIYLKPPDAAKAEKLKVMTRGQSRELLGVAAWPTDLLVDERGAVRGFLMGRISARQDAHRLYSPKSRRRTFPDADFRFVVRAATNLARAFAQVHAAGHVIGDVNHGNALIGKDGTAVLIDCDSIQVRDQARTFACDVGSPLFTPPELQGKAFRGLRRAENHDRFGLAVLLFHLLFQGRHPYAGVFADGEMPIERAIAESRFAYGTDAALVGMSPPPGTLALTTFGPPIAELFERAFAPPGIAERPSAIEWIEPLRILESGLMACAVRPRHFAPPGPGCCWCGIESVTGARLFDPEQAATAQASAVSAEELWRAIEVVRAPPQSPEFPGFALESLMARPTIGRLRGLIANANSDTVFSLVVFAIAGLYLLPAAIPRALVFAGAALMVAGAVWAVSVSKKFAKVRRFVLHEWENALVQWRNSTSADAFFRLRTQLAESRHKLGAIDERRTQEIDRVAQRLQEKQREAFMDTFDIDKAWLVDVTGPQVARLASRGIRSAGDILRYRRKLHHFVSPAAVSELRKWADLCAKQFKVDVNEPEYRAQVEKVEARFRLQRESIIHDLRRGPELLAAKREEIDKSRERAEQLLKTTHEMLRRRRELEKN
jgi:DNA-binding helix-hairpin-helix protein with protein kinase domain